MKKIFRIPNFFAVKLIVLYQRTLSPDHGFFKMRFPYGFCRHYPSCSEYSKKAYLKRSFVVASLLSLKRIASCNPFTEPRVDNVS